MTYITSPDFKRLARTEKTLSVPKIRKDFSADVEEGEGRQLRFTISTSNIDRDSDCVAQDGWKLDNYLKNPVVLFAHDSDSLPIGKCVDIGILDGKLRATVEFVPADMPVVGDLAEAIFRMCKSNFLSATSVGFRPIEWEWSDNPDRPDGIDYQKTELCEFSIVPVPANPFALIERINSNSDVNINRSSDSKERVRRRIRILELQRF